MIPLSRSETDSPFLSLRKYPLTPEQQRLWIEWKLNPESRAFNTSFQLKMKGQLNLVRLKQALVQHLKFLDVARTGLCEDQDGTPSQIVFPYEEIKKRFSELPGFEYIDLTIGRTVSSDLEAEARKIVIDRIRRCYDLLTYPAWAYTIVKWAAEEYYLVLAAAHIHCDGFTGAASLKLITELYNRPPKLAGLVLKVFPKLGLIQPIDDYLKYLEEKYTAERQNADGRYWRKRLQGAPLSLDFKLPRKQSKITNRGRRIRFHLNSTVTGKMRAFIKQQKTTLFIFLSTVYNILLFRYTGQTDIVIAHPSTTRPSKFWIIMGFFVNNTLMRTRLEPSLNFLELLRQVGTQRWEDRAHKRYPYSALVQDMRRERGQNVTIGNISLGETAFGTRQLRFRGLKIEPVLDMDYGEVIHDLNLLYDADKKANELELALEYRSTLFEKSFIDHMTVHFQTLTANLLDSPRVPLGKILMLSPGEQKKIRGWNATRRAFPDEKSLNQLFEETVDQYPHLPAVAYEDRSLTYAELNNRVNQLAHHLMGKYRGATDFLVGVTLERSLDMIISLLAIIKAGGAYVPLDPSYPEERLRTIVSDANITTILSHSYLAERLQGCAADILCLNEIRGDLQQESLINPSLGIKPTSLAYVIYTSGSTGRPKGVMIEHRSLVNRLCWMQNTFCLRTGECVFQKTPYSFDVSVWEFFWPLIVGACLQIARPEGHKDPQYIIDQIQKYRVTTIHFVPSMLRLFLETYESQPLPLKGLTRIICSGEGLPATLGVKCLELLPDTELYNLYGPTEATVDVSFYQYNKGIHETCVTVPIGRPIENTELYILDAQRNLLPIGCPGELHIGGVGLARGYINNQELTREKFIPHPFRVGSGERLYKTGDLARYLPDGNIDFLGRIDTQVKWHGFRIELGEIEKTLLHAPDVSQAVVTVREDTPTKKQLVAYIVRKSQGKIFCMDEYTQELKTHMRKTLPGYMIPAYIEYLDEIPLSLNGKCNNKMLPPVRLHQVQTEQSCLAPKNDREEKWLKLWQDVLGTEKHVGIEENFFNLGGDSLLAIKLINSAQQAGFDVSVVQLFENPTISGLAGLEDGGKTGSERITTKDLESVTIPRKGFAFEKDNIEAAYELTKMQQFMVNNYGRRDHCYHFQYAIYFEEEGFEPHALIAAAQLLMDNHPILRTSFLHRSGGSPCQIVHREANLPLEQIEYAMDGTSEQRHTYLMNLLKTDRENRPFDTQNGQSLLYRIYLVRFSDTAYGLALAWHHAAIDGWSNIEFLRNLFQNYFLIKNSGSVPPPEPRPNSLHEFVAYEKKICSRSEIREFWEKKLQDHPGPKFRRLSRKERVENTPETLTQLRLIDESLGRRLMDKGRQRGIQVKTIFLAAYLEMLAGLYDQSRLSVGIVTNRRTPLLSDPVHCIGNFWNLMPFIFNCDQSLKISPEGVSRELEQYLPYESYPLGQIEQDIGKSSDEIFPATFNFIHFHNASEIIRLLDRSDFQYSMEAHDIFHFPMNMVCQQVPLKSSVNIFLSFDPDFFMADKTVEITDDLMNLLQKYTV